MSKNTVRIEAYSLFEFMLTLQEKFIEGYRVSDDIENFPSSFVGYYTAGLVKASQEESKVEKPEVQETPKEEVKPAQKGRPAKK